MRSFCGFAAALAVMASGCGETQSGPPPSHCEERECTDFRAIAWIEKGKDAVRLRLNDPGSAEFRGVFFHTAPGSPPFICGEVNAKNKLGGMAGFRRFLSAGSAETTFMESDGSDFDVAWLKYCKA